MSEPHERLDRAMRARGIEVKKKWIQISKETGISTAALGAYRRGEYQPSAHNARLIDEAYEWEHGSVEAILAGGEPTPLPIAGTLPALTGQLEGRVDDDEPEFEEGSIRRRVEELIRRRKLRQLDRALSLIEENDRDAG